MVHVSMLINKGVTSTLILSDADSKFSLRIIFLGYRTFILEVESEDEDNQPNGLFGFIRKTADKYKAMVW